MRRFYIKISGAYLRKTTEGFEYCLDLAESEGVLYAHKFTDKEYDSIKPLLPKDHTLELVVDEKTMPKWVKNAIVSVLIYFLCVLVISIALKTQTSKVCFIFLIGFFSNDIVRWITNRKK